MKIVLQLLLTVTIVWSPIWHIYWSNLDNFNLSLDHFWRELSLASVLVFFATGLLQAAARAMGQSSLMQLFLLYVGTVACLLVSFLVGDYGFLEGAEPVWSDNDTTGYLELVTIISLAALFVTYRHAIIENLSFLSWTVVFVSLAFFPTMVREGSDKGYSLTDGGLYELSKRQNVFLFVLDTMQADAVNEVFAGNTMLRKQYKDFTFYRNATSAFPKTYTSVPSILTSQVFDNSVPVDEFMSSAYEDSLPRLLNESGFDVRLWGFAPQVFKLDLLLADNVVKAGEDWSQSIENRDLALLANLSLFKLSPHFLRPYIYNQGEFIWGEGTDNSGDCQLDQASRRFSKKQHQFDSKFFDEFLHCTEIKKEEPVFRVFHLRGVHQPLRHDNRFEFVGNQPLGRAALVTQTEGALFAVGSLFDRLEALGVMQDAIVIITSDHGAGWFGHPVNKDQPGLPERLFSETQASNLGKVIAGGIPLFMVKTASPGKAFTIDDKPVELPDVPATLMDLIGADHPFTGQSVVKPIDSDRVRYHKYYEFNGWDIDFIAPMTEYIVNGFSWYPENWRISGRDFDSQAITNFDGVLVLFSREDYRLSGWQNDKGSMRIKDRIAEVTIEEPVTGPMLLKVNHRRFRSNEAASITVSAGRVKRQWSFHPKDRQRNKVIILPEDVFDGAGEKTIGFEADEVNAVAPGFTELSLSSLKSFCKVGTDISFAQGAAGTKLTTFGWLPARALMTESLDHSSGLACRLDKMLKGGLKLSFSINPMVFPSHPEQLFQLTINGELNLTYRLSALSEISAVVPESVYLNKRFLELVFKYDNPIRPSDINPQWSTNKTSISILSMRIDPASD